MNHIPSVWSNPVSLIQYYPVFEVIVLYECRRKTRARASKMYYRNIKSWSTMPLNDPTLPYSLCSRQTPSLIIATAIVINKSIIENISPAKKVNWNLSVMLWACFERHGLWSVKTCSANNTINAMITVVLMMLKMIQLMLILHVLYFYSVLDLLPGSEALVFMPWGVSRVWSLATFIDWNFFIFSILNVSTEV